MTNPSRRKFLASVSMLSASALLPSSAFSFASSDQKLKVALVGTGIRGSSFWGKRLVDQYSDILEFVGLSDINPGRLEAVKEHMKVDCPTFVDLNEMLELLSRIY